MTLDPHPLQPPTELALAASCQETCNKASQYDKSKEKHMMLSCVITYDKQIGKLHL